MHQEECSERLRLVDEYSTTVTAFQLRMESLRRSPQDQNDADWLAIHAAKVASEAAWGVLERHISEHQCLSWYRSGGDASGSGAGASALEKAAAAALDIIMVADDERRFVEVNDAAADILGLPRSEIVGRRIEEFFSKASGETVASAWNRFVSEGVQRGVCELLGPGKRRRFEYHAKSGFAPGLHLSVLREME